MEVELVCMWVCAKCVCVYALMLFHSNLVAALEQLHSIKNNFLTAVENTRLNFQGGRHRHTAPARGLLGPAPHGYSLGQRQRKSS